MGGNSTTGTVTLNAPAPPSGLAVLLDSDNGSPNGSRERLGPCRRDVGHVGAGAYLQFEVSDVGLSGLAFDLFNGAVNADNTVSIPDFLILRSSFGSSPGWGNWDVRADLNRSGSVNVQDFLILRKNFGRSGA